MSIANIGFSYTKSLGPCNIDFGLRIQRSIHRILSRTAAVHKPAARYTSDRANVDVGGQLNYGRVFSEATGDAEDRIDLLTVAMHEIGHALGLDYEYSGFKAQLVSNEHVKITPPLPYAGLKVRIAFGPHVGSFSITEPLMVPDPTPGLAAAYHRH